MGGGGWERCHEERAGKQRLGRCWRGGGGRGVGAGSGLSLVVEGALLPGHSLDGARHRGGFERGGPVRMEPVADGVDGGEGPLWGQREGVLVLGLHRERERKRERDRERKRERGRF